MADPFEQGRDARIEGKLLSSNPFLPTKDGAWYWWRDGWIKAHEVLERAEREAHGLRRNGTIEEDGK